MRRVLLVLLVACGVTASCGDPPPVPPETGETRRIVSMAPALTEIAFALGLGDHVVGVTRYCQHPPEVRDLPAVGGYLDPSYEALVALEPDLVLLMQSHDRVAARLATLGIPSLVTDQEDLGGVLESIETIAAVCGVPAAGRELRRKLEARLERVRARVAGRPRPTVLVSVGRAVGQPVTRTWAAGPATFYHDAVRIAGGRNVVEQVSVPYPEIGSEGLLRLAPEVIVEVLPETRPDERATAAADWRRLEHVPAVRNDRVEVVAGTAMVVPGPRIVDLVEAMAEAIHPGIARGAGS